MSDTTSDPYAGIDLPKPPRGYRLAKWGEENRWSLWYDPTFLKWRDFFTLTSWWYKKPQSSIFAVPKPRIRIELEQGGEVE